MNNQHAELQYAILIAVEAHNGQVDKAGQPYILHPLKVMHYTKSDDVKVLCTAVLHDAVEDNKNITFQYLRDQKISEVVIEAVRALTKMPGQSYEEYKAAVKANSIARKVKMADLRHNSDIRRLKGVSEKDIERIARYQKFYMELQGIENAEKN